MGDGPGRSPGAVPAGPSGRAPRAGWADGHRHQQRTAGATDGQPTERGQQCRSGRRARGRHAGVHRVGVAVRSSANSTRRVGHGCAPGRRRRHRRGSQYRHRPRRSGSCIAANDITVRANAVGSASASNWYTSPLTVAVTDPPQADRHPPSDRSTPRQAQPRHPHRTDPAHTGHPTPAVRSPQPPQQQPDRPLPLSPLRNRTSAVRDEGTVGVDQEVSLGATQPAYETPRRVAIR